MSKTLLFCFGIISVSFAPIGSGTSASDAAVVNAGACAPGVINLSQLHTDELVRNMPKEQARATLTSDCQGNRLAAHEWRSPIGSMPDKSIGIPYYYMLTGSGVAKVVINAETYFQPQVTRHIVSDEEYTRLKSTYPQLRLPTSPYARADSNVYGRLEKSSVQYVQIMSIAQFVSSAFEYTTYPSDDALSEIPIATQLSLLMAMRATAPEAKQVNYDNCIQYVACRANSCIVEARGQQLLVKCIASGVMHGKTYAYVSEATHAELRRYTAARTNTGVYGYAPLAPKSDCIVLQGATGNSLVHVFDHKGAMAMNADNLAPIANAVNSSELRDLVMAKRCGDGSCQASSAVTTQGVQLNARLSGAFDKLKPALEGLSREPKGLSREPKDLQKLRDIFIAREEGPHKTKYWDFWVTNEHGSFANTVNNDDVKLILQAAVEWSVMNNAPGVRDQLIAIASHPYKTLAECSALAINATLRLGDADSTKGALEIFNRGWQIAFKLDRLNHNSANPTTIRQSLLSLALDAAKERRDVAYAVINAAANSNRDVECVMRAVLQVSEFRNQEEVSAIMKMIMQSASQDSFGKDLGDLAFAVHEAFPSEYSSTKDVFAKIPVVVAEILVNPAPTETVASRFAILNYLDINVTASIIGRIDPGIINNDELLSSLLRSGLHGMLSLCPKLLLLQHSQLSANKKVEIAAKLQSSDSFIGTEAVMTVALRPLLTEFNASLELELAETTDEGRKVQIKCEKSIVASALAGNTDIRHTLQGLRFFREECEAVSREIDRSLDDTSA